MMQYSSAVYCTSFGADWSPAAMSQYFLIRFINGRFGSFPAVTQQTPADNSMLCPDQESDLHVTPRWGWTMVWRQRDRK